MARDESTHGVNPGQETVGGKTHGDGPRCVTTYIPGYGDSPCDEPELSVMLKDLFPVACCEVRGGYVEK